MATKSNQFYIIGKNGDYRKKPAAVSGDFDITDIMQFDPYWYITAKGSFSLVDKNFRFIRFIKDPYGNTHATYGLEAFNGKVYGLLSRGVFRLKNNVIVAPILLPSPSRCLAFYNREIIFVGCRDGLYKVSADLNEAIKITGITAPVTKILKCSDGSLLAATRGEGLFVVEDDIAKRFHINRPVQPDIIFDMGEDKYKNLWIATNTGLIKVHSTSGLPVEEYNRTNGLLASDVKKVAINSKYIYVSTTEGLCSIELEQKKLQLAAPTIYIDSVTVNGRRIDHRKGSIDLQYCENSIAFSFDALTFKFRQSNMPLLKYKLAGMGYADKTSLQNELRFDNLPPGEYELIAYALSATGLKSATPVTFRFSIQKPFWQTAWFIVGSFVLFFTAVFFIVRRIILTIKRREQEKTRLNKLIAESQLSALQARMNPHFVFNAINSIQNYILNKNEQEAYNYLAKFSKLIRMMLNNSKENAIALHEELEALKLYVELEQLRFAHSFTYLCELSGDLDEYEVYIPVMLIQPYIENAIGHGLINLDNEREGILKLVIVKENDLLKIIIEDNGIGRERAHTYKKANIYQPVAMKLNEKRLEIIGKIKEYEEIRIVVTDLTDANGNACGTRVELYLPLNV